jgi:hypothetical protein
MTVKTTLDTKAIPTAAPAPVSGCCGGDVIPEYRSKASESPDPPAVGHAEPKAARACCCGGAEKKYRPPDLIDFAMTPNRRLSAVRCQET